MKKPRILLLVLASVTILQACGTNTTNETEDQTGTFEVPFEMHVPATQQEDGSWIVSNGRFIATFNQRGNATQYELRVIREDQSKGEPFIYTHRQLLGHRPEGSKLSYSEGIGSPFTHSGLDTDRKDQLTNEIIQQLNNVKHLYLKLEVTPL